MPLILLETYINAPVEIVFDLSRSVDLHKASMKKHKEEIVDGVQRGLMKEGDTVTWRARHFFKTRTLKVKLTELYPPVFFADRMLEGDFKKMRHEHYFKTVNEGTLMIDEFTFESPFGLLGKMVNRLFLTNYMKTLLCQRNDVIKRIAEEKRHHEFLT